eukprot:Phypoly_transcript_18057.p1 GENE.Phypoly_transcript_18057~~Phypoly_transcript_18057.p1  ORF type:complete len:218 (+),score=-0.83 Phypoly_transcript_18057:88-741(+)
MLGYLLAHISFFTQRRRVHANDEEGKIHLRLFCRKRCLSFLPLVFSALLMCLYLIFAIVGYTSQHSCTSLLATFLILLFLYSILMMGFSIIFSLNKCDSRNKLLVYIFHSFGCMYLFTTTAGFVVIFGNSIQPGPPENCRILIPWLYYLCLIIAGLNLVSGLVFCPLSCMHLFFYVCGNMTCPQGANCAEGNVENCVAQCADLHPEFFPLGAIQNVV